MARNGQYYLVGDAAPPGERSPRQIRELLATAQGYVVVARDGKRVGAFIELVGTKAEQIAIRHDGTFFWRRRYLPITTVGTVLPKQRAVVLNIERRSIAKIEKSDAMVERALPADEAFAFSDDIQGRIARYLAPGAQAADSPPNGAPPHLIFVSSTRGYTLVERHGPLPRLGEDIELAEQPGSFVVVKLGPSPLPNDSRVCAYLEPKDVGSLTT